MGGIVCTGLKIPLVRDIAGDIGVERDCDFYERLKIFDSEAARIMNKDKKGRTEADEEWQASVEALRSKHGGQ